MSKLSILAVALALTLAGSAGVFAAVALSQTAEPTKTVTINVATGPQGEQGPRGEPGPAGPQGPPGDPSDCGTGYTWSIVVFNAPGGQETLKACVKD